MTIIKFKLKSDEENRHFPFAIRELLVGVKQFAILDDYHLRAMRSKF
ncbi:hypothetical protein FAM21834_00089 [Lentilactobacillus parabuchneri]|jgi:hypothetical protein|uniref:Uncharacterized protein n=1 Tax=Lentilactobacillus parabuchneri TaxID=152331 RepID=A0A1X1FHY9_9LACO|nr:hypothetical protein FAM21731_00107 [Lentilactobacillus parabuchneri]ORN01554.1 hypothetical protein FAM21829_02558 [Lentilactobacillus parabuchneri]ORN04340.1 hypothetical protein FAM21823_00173 [Lentilactobacillus parabuchneri]ORN07214.1 hypothetical protein FAM23163_02427 [Lentilactobacillus parabuchneri]ORN12464.1 hypothetical protein FAM21834_00089 [Lentilactobacillus parabuchneri]